MAKFIFILLFGVEAFTLKAVASENFQYTARSIVHSYGKKEYNAANQNWSISQDRKGVVYFGNTSGLLEYNGSEWSLYQLPDKLIIRSVFADASGVIFTGAHEEFGYWLRDEYGKLSYRSLTGLLPKGYKFANEDIWNIKRIGRLVYFQSFSKVYTYDGSAVRILNFGKPIFSLMNYGGRPVVSFIEGGIGTIAANGKLIPMSAIPAGLGINNILPLSKDTTVIITELKGMHLLVKGQYQGEWNCVGSRVLQEAHINRSLVLSGYGLVVGTINNGIYLLDKSGTIIKNWNTSNGLQNNTILSLSADSKKNLWIGLDRGIDYLDLNAPFTLFLEGRSSIGSVYCAVTDGSRLYVGTNHGLFYSSWNPLRYESLSFTPFPNFKGQVWNLQQVGETILCGTNAGTFSIVDGHLKRVSEVNGGNQLAAPVSHSNILFQGTYTGIAIYRKDAAKGWVYVKNLSNFGGPIKTLQFDSENTLWAGDMYKGLYRIWLNESFDAATKVEKFGKKDGLPSDYNIQVFKVGNTILFSTLDKFYTYDFINQKIAEFKSINEQVKDYTTAHSVYKTGGNGYWFAKNNAMQLFRKQGELLTPRTQVSLRALGVSAVDGYENISELGNDRYLIGLDNGFVVYHPTPKISGGALEAKPSIFRVETYSNGGDLKLAKLEDGVAKIGFNHRNVVFYFSSPGEVAGACIYYYRFDGNGDWVEAKDYSVAINSLSAGSHTLQIKSVNRTTNQESSTTYSFKIRPPWYAHPLALLIYLLLVGVIYKLVRYTSEQRVRKQKYESLKRLKELHRIRVEQLQKDHLMRQVENKATELANYAMLMRTKSDVLQKIKDLIQSASTTDLSLGNTTKKSILSLVDKNLTSNSDWEHFSGYFDEANLTFTTRLKKLHSDLTPNDLRFCSFLRMNMSSKEISNLLNISERSVEVKRYRLRKKLEMEHDQNLIDYLINL